jgi:hypothetical protein
LTSLYVYLPAMKKLGVEANSKQYGECNEPGPIRQRDRLSSATELLQYYPFDRDKFSSDGSWESECQGAVFAY